jgi:peptidoglycan/xylan/chitin deacetylase (PgdA/CDA1 family)|tara:strand:- start:1424 stop:2386 length:963 start_codon:yes stop_codon:yes gene_type:complete
MYFAQNNNFFHGIMFHHFHNDKIHKRGQGSISKDDLYKLIKFLGRQNILNAEEFFIRFKENRLTKRNICLTFDDSLKCQYDIALPVLEDLNIKSFFFVYSSVFSENPDLLEVYRYFRMNYFKNVDEFYKSFFKIYNKNLSNYFNEKKSIIKKTKQQFPYYSFSDIKFRLVRDKILNKDEYQKIMFKMFKQKKFNPKKFYDILFMSKSNLIEIKELGHIVGLHSHTHPTLLEKSSYNEQLKQYTNNINIISNILKCKTTDIVSMSHPRGSYDGKTLKILKNLGIEIGFKPSMFKGNKKKINNSKYEIARQDHMEVIRMMNL